MTLFFSFFLFSLFWKCPHPQLPTSLTQARTPVIITVQRISLAPFHWVMVYLSTGLWTTQLFYEATINTFGVFYWAAHNRTPPLHQETPWKAWQDTGSHNALSPRSRNCPPPVLLQGSHRAKRAVKERRDWMRFGRSLMPAARLHLGGKLQPPRYQVAPVLFGLCQLGEGHSRGLPTHRKCLGTHLNGASRPAEKKAPHLSRNGSSLQGLGHFTQLVRQGGILFPASCNCSGNVDFLIHIEIKEESNQTDQGTTAWLMSQLQQGFHRTTSWVMRKVKVQLQ